MRIYFVENNERIAAFFCDTLGIYPVAPEEKSVLLALNNKLEPPSSLIRDKWATIIENEKRRLEQFEKKNCDCRQFYTLILNVSNTCNMRCKYCFANHGEYASPKGIMPVSTALQAVQTCYRLYGFIGEIKFFGGEPLMATDVVRAVCEYVTDEYQKGHIQRLPEFRIISNGTIMNNDICDLITKYDLQYVVSMDGTSELHDACRKMCDGKGSYEKIMENLAFFKKKTGRIPSGIEITWNGNHEKQGASVMDVICSLQEKTGVDASRINLSCVMVKKGCEESLKSSEYAMADYLDEIFEQKRRTGRDYADKKFRGLIHMLHGRMRSGNQICEAGIGCLSVSAQGNVYPCLMFTDVSEFLMGKISVNPFEYADNYFEEIATTKRLSKESCRECWANRICRQCMGINRFQTGKFDVPLKEYCVINRKRIEKAILSISEGLY